MTESNPGARPVPAPPRRDIRDRMEIARIADWQVASDPDLAVFTIVKPDGGDFFEFETGQYLQLAFRDQPDEDPRPRQMSIASTPLDRDHLEFYVILVRDELPDGSERTGTFTGTLWSHRPGDEILHMTRPAGRFVPSRTPQRDLVCVATGTGLAPFVSMARTFWRQYKESGQVDRRLTILHAVSYTNQLGYREELERMAADERFGLLYVPAVSRPEQDDEYTEVSARGRANDLVRLRYGLPKSGRVDPWIPPYAADAFEQRLTQAGSAVYLCGNPGMISDAKALLENENYVVGGREAQVITEDYW